MKKRLLKFWQWFLDLPFGPAPKWGDEAKVDFSDADLATIQQLEIERKMRRGL